MKPVVHIDAFYHHRGGATMGLPFRYWSDSSAGLLSPFCPISNCHFYRLRCTAGLREKEAGNHGAEFASFPSLINFL
jgi:hypothetical protein